MQKLILSIIFLFIFTDGFTQETDADKVVGEWLNEEKNSKIEVYKNGNLYFGKIIWGADIFESDGQTSKKDVKNSDKKLADRNLLNLTVLHDFQFIDGIWENGKMYDPKIGKTYHCIIKLKDNQLQIRSYVGIPLFGKTTYWKRFE